MLRIVTWPWRQIGCPCKQSKQAGGGNALFCALRFTAGLLVGMCNWGPPSYLGLRAMLGAPSIRLPPTAPSPERACSALTQQCHQRPHAGFRKAAPAFVPSGAAIELRRISLGAQVRRGRSDAVLCADWSLCPWVSAMIMLGFIQHQVAALLPLAARLPLGARMRPEKLQ